MKIIKSNMEDNKNGDSSNVFIWRLVLSSHKKNKK
jgi:hypothetical protein